jgi:hypothetical protein
LEALEGGSWEECGTIGVIILIVDGGDNDDNNDDNDIEPALLICCCWCGCWLLLPLLALLDDDAPRVDAICEGAITGGDTATASRGDGCCSSGPDNDENVDCEVV